MSRDIRCFSVCFIHCLCVCIVYIVTSQLITLHDGTAYNSSEVVWNSEPKDIGKYYIIFVQ